MNAKRILSLLLICILLVGITAAAPIAAADTETEPNDTPVNATAISYGDEIYAEISPAGDVDYYQFTGQAGDYVLFQDVDGCYLMDDYGSWSRPIFSLYDENLNLLADKEQSHFALPADGTYYIKVTANPEPDYPETGAYSLFLLLREGDEPDDSFDLARPISYGETVSGEIFPASDEDRFWFNGRAGDVISITVDNADPDGLDEYSIALFGPNRYVLVTDGAIDFWPHIQYVLPQDGVYYISIDDPEFCYPYGYGGGSYELTLERSHSLYVSAAADKLGGNAAISRGDIATRDPVTGKWVLVFDASDVGIKQNINAFEWTSADRLLFSLQKPQTIKGLGKVKPTDILRFTPTQLGENTQGTLSFFMKGADVGLTTAGERIDAIAWEQPYPIAGSRLLISTVGAGKVPKTGGGNLAFADEDVIVLDQASSGQPVQGTWQLYLDGSAISGLKKANIGSLTTAPPFSSFDDYNAVLLAALPGKWNVDGVKGNAKDVLRLQRGWEVALQAPLLTNKAIDGLSLGPVWRP